MSLESIIKQAEEKMQKSEEHLTHELSGVRTGKASPALVENIQVEVYGSQMRIRDLAGITSPDVRSLVIQPWDASTVHPIEKAIQKTDLGINPIVDGKILRIVMPELSTERRIEFTKIVKKMAEDCRVAVRHVRREGIDALKKEAKQGGVTEDEQQKFEKEIQKLTDHYVKRIDEHLAHKEKEIMTV